MDANPKAPFTPPFYDQPMAIDDGFDMQLDDWTENGW
jgi:hypothetical protein